MATTRSSPAERDPWPADPKPAHLGFLRWLAERDLIEHPSLGSSSGRYAAGATRAETSRLLIDRVHQSLDEIGYLRAGVVEPGYFLDEPEPGTVRLRWGYDCDGTFIPLREPDNWVAMCGDYLLSDGFDVRQEGWPTSDVDAILISG